MKLFRVRLLPAGHGDCILVEYGNPTSPARILIDGGTAGTWGRLEKVLRALQPAERKLELIVVTHVDADHIAGMLGLFKATVPGLTFEDIWFNGYRHLSGLEEMGPVQGEALTTELLKHRPRWNKEFEGKAVALPDDGKPVTKTLAGGMKLTLLSPTQAKLRDLKDTWKVACEEAGLDPTMPAPPPVPAGLEPMGPINVEALVAAPFHEDDANANGSSIAFIAEYDGRSLLFGADAHPSLLEAAIRRLPGGRAKVGAFKVPHHGSKHNLSDALLSVVETRRFLFSTNGAYFKHPDRESIARIVAKKIPDCELRFNYRTKYTEVWESDTLQGDWGYDAVLPDAGQEGETLEL